MKIEALTGIELELANYLARTGANSTQIMAHYGIPLTTLKSRIHSIFVKTGTFSRLELIINWRCEIFQIGLREMGIIPK